MKPRDLKGRFIKSTPKTISDLFGGRSTPSPVNPEDRYSGNTKGKAQEIISQLGSSDKSIKETKKQQLEEFRNTSIETPVTNFSFLQPIQTTLPDFSILKERVKGIGNIEKELSASQLPNPPQVFVIITHTTSTQEGPVLIDIVDSRKFNALLRKSANTVVSQT